MRHPYQTHRSTHTGTPPGNAAARLFDALCRHTSLALATALLCLYSLAGHAAYDISSPPAQLTWSGATVPATANVSVIRFEDTRLYRLDSSGTPIQIFESHFADVDSLSGSTPSTTGALPPALDRNGNPITLNQPVGLTQTGAITPGETLFVVVDQPLLPASAFGTRSDGRRFLAVTLSVDDAGSVNDYIIALVETAPGSNTFAGYLPDSATTPLPSGAGITLRYETYGDVADSDTAAAPWNISAAEISAAQANRFALVGLPPAPPVPGLFLTKEALRTSAAQGELAPYRLRLSNTGNVTETNVVITDTLPVGLKLRSDSVRLNGDALATTIAADGRTLSFAVGDMAPGDEFQLEYVTDVTVTTGTGDVINTAVAEADSGNRSNQAQATLRIERAFNNDRAFLMGRVIIGECGDRTGVGKADVRLYMEDGRSIITDDQGRWHFEGIKPGTHVVQIDTDSLGPRYSLQLCDNTSRKAGNPASRFVELQGGSLWREEFYLAEKPLVSAHIEQQLLSRVIDGTVELSLPLGNGETEFEQVDISLYLPDSLTPVPGSMALDGSPVSDPLRGENFYAMTLRPNGQYWQHSLTLSLAVDPDVREGARQTIMVRSRGRTPQGKHHTVTSTNEIDLTPAQVQHATLTLHPEFSPGSAELSDIDMLSIEQTAQFLKNFHNVTLSIVGHTDSVPIRRGPGQRYANNDALSLARATAVANALRSYVELPEDAITVDGVGAREPVASNDLPSGRARNRRVEIAIQTVDRVTDAKVALVNGDSGVARAGEQQARRDDSTRPGFKNLQDGMKLSLPVISVNGTLDSRLTPRLTLNGEIVPNTRLAMKIPDEANQVTHYTWLGIELPDTGDYELVLSGIGPFGNVRFEQPLRLTRTSDVKAIRLGPQPENIADGKSPIRVKLDMIDQSGRKIESRTDFQLLSGTLVPLATGARNDELNRRRGIVEVDAEGYAWFDPVSDAGTYRIRLGNDRVQSDELEVVVAPQLRDWILVGFAKGSVGYNTLHDNIDPLPDAEKDSFTDGEAAFFARGRISSDWLLTMSYDSRREAGDTPLGGQHSPEEWYVLYGDSAQQQNHAATQEKLYLRIERKDFYALFGDFDTGLTVTELSRYQRTLTGFKSELRSKHVSANVFVANTAQTFDRVDIPGDGTSGLYRIGAGKMVPGSETIRVETRDRFNNSIIESSTRTRYIDYSLDYDDGTLYFREPISSQDAQFNPVYIVVEFERDQGIENVTGGGRVALHSEDRALEVGISAIHEGSDTEQGDLQGVDLQWRPNAHHTIKAEVAQSTQQQVAAADLSDQAWLVEHEYLSEKLDTRVRVEQQQPEFGLGQQAASESGVAQASAAARYRITESYTLSTELRRQTLIDQDQQRDSLDGRLNYDHNDWLVYGGVRTARDTIGDDEYSSDLLTAGVSKKLLERKLTLSADGETDVGGDADNNDYPNKLGLDADYRFSRIASLFASQEFAWGEQYRAHETRAGIRATPWKGGTLTTDVGQATDEYGPRVFTHAGLYQTLQLTSQWSADFGADRAQTLKQGSRNPSFDDGRRPPASGTNSDDYTALAVGLGYRDADWQWTSRVENRLSDYSDKWNLFSGFHHRLDGANTLIGRISHRDEHIHAGSNEWETQLDLSLSHRPNDSSWWLLNRSSLILDGLDDSYGRAHGRRVVNNFTSNFTPSEQHQLALMYGARYVLESINGEHYDGYSDLMSAEYRYNLTEHWDIGARGSLLKSWQAGNSDRSYGVMVGVSPIKDVWISLGYNFRGFYDSDFDNANSRVGGIVLDFRIKFDQNSFRRQDRAQPAMQ